VGVRLAIAAIGLGLLASATAARGAAEQPKGYSFAVVPQGPPEKVRAIWLPVIERLSAQTHVPLELRLYSTADEFQADLAAGKVDFAYANPVQALRARRAAGYLPLVRDEAPVRGVFVVPVDSPYLTVEDLAHREVAFIAEWTFCSVSLRSHVRQELGISPKYVGTSANVYKSVLLGLTAAGGILDSSLADASAEVRARLRVLYATQPMAAHAVVAHPRVPRDVADLVTAGCLALARTDAALMASARLGSPVVAVYARDYAPLESIVADDTADPKPQRRAQ
jgi:phosphonate transport system substrate-binding protein